MSNNWKPYQHHYPDPLGDLFRQLKQPQIERKWIPMPPIRIEPRPGQIREGGKLKDLFDPDFPPMIIPRPKPKPTPIKTTPIYVPRPGEAFARTTPPLGSLGGYAVGLG